jgi:hypothetical protein
MTVSAHALRGSRSRGEAASLGGAVAHASRETRTVKRLARISPPRFNSDDLCRKLMLMRFDPFREMDRIAQMATEAAQTPRSFPLDAYRRGEEFIVQFDLPASTRHRSI